MYILKFDSTKEIKKKSTSACIILLLTAPQLGHIRNTALALPGHYENSLRFDVKHVILFLLIYWLKQITALFWLPVYWCYEKEELRLKVKNSSVVDLGGKNTCETVAFLLLPSWILCFTCAEDGAVLAQLFADACNSYICCWIHPQSPSLCSHIRPSQCTTHPVSCRMEKEQRGDLCLILAEIQSTKFTFSSIEMCPAEQMETCSVFVGGVAIGHLLSPPEAHHFHATVVALVWWLV